METIIFNDQGGYMTPIKNTTTFDKSKLWLSLSNDCKNFVKRDEFDFSDLLHSPDFNFASPNVESLVFKSLESPPALKSTCLSPAFLQPDVCRPDAALQQVTREQEIFAQGFTDALKKIQRREEATKDDYNPEIVKEDTVPDDNKEESTPENPKCHFISYNFDSCQPLPSFHETFCHLTELNLSEHKKYRERCKRATGVPPEFVFWDKIETVDEGFSVQPAQNYTLQECTSPTQVSYDYESDVSVASPTLQSPFSGYNSQENEDEVFCFNPETDRDLAASDSSMEEEEWLSILQTADDTPTEKHWLTVHTKLYNNTRTVDNIGQLPVIPMDFDVQDLMKTDRKRRKNRLAAWKCRQKKLVRESRLETTVEDLCAENAKLQEELEKLKRKRQRLQDTFISHASGCRQAQVQYCQTFVPTTS